MKESLTSVACNSITPPFVPNPDSGSTPNPTTNPANDQSNLQDRTLISRTRDGDHAAFEELVRKYQHHLLNLVCWHAGPAADTDDILQLILCKVYFSLKKFDLTRPFYPWLRRIAVNRCFDERRRLRRRKALTFAELDIEESHVEAETPAMYSANPFAEENRRELGDMLQTVLRQLPKDYRDILVLHHLEQLPYEEIAPMLNCSPQAARVKACRARAALRRLLLHTCEDSSVPFASSDLMRILDACCRRSPKPAPKTSRISPRA
ncbi:MAG: sigma-70 family RNA polymerase sigma factor, partial [Acidobacteriota bacterium]|nr:sigma-70 family RNA polymerase sigma factor [Acidobacteriota bacterium]